MESDGLVLHLFSYEWQGDVPLLVSPGTVEAARRATADEAPHPPMDFGDACRTGDLIELEELLGCDFRVSLEEYVAGMEAAARRSPEGGDVAARLVALDDFDFAGDDTPTGT